MLQPFMGSFPFFWRMLMESMEAVFISDDSHLCGNKLSMVWFAWFAWIVLAGTILYTCMYCILYILIYWHIYMCQLALHPQVGAFYRCCSGPNPISLGPKVTFNCSTGKPPSWGKLPLRILWLRCQVKWNEGWQWQEGLWYVPEVPQWLRCAGGQKKLKEMICLQICVKDCEGICIVIPVHICAGRMCIYIYSK